MVGAHLIPFTRGETLPFATLASHCAHHAKTPTSNMVRYGVHLYPDSPPSTLQCVIDAIPVQHRHRRSAPGSYLAMQAGIRAVYLELVLYYGTVCSSRIAPCSRTIAGGLTTYGRLDLTILMTIKVPTSINLVRLLVCPHLALMQTGESLGMVGKGGLLLMVSGSLDHDHHTTMIITTHRARLVASETSLPISEQSTHWAHSLPAPEQGCLLIAHPLMFMESQVW